MLRGEEGGADTAGAVWLALKQMRLVTMMYGVRRSLVRDTSKYAVVADGVVAIISRYRQADIGRVFSARVLLFSGIVGAEGPPFSGGDPNLSLVSEGCLIAACEASQWDV